MGYWATEWYYDSAIEIPRSISRHVGADRIHRVLAYLCARADDDTAEACPSQREIAERLGGMDRRDVRAAITALEDLGLIVPVAPSIRRVRGVVYRLELAQFPGFDKGGVPPRIAARLGRGTPPQAADEVADDKGGVPPEQVRDKGGAKGGVPRPDQLINYQFKSDNGLGPRATPSGDDDESAGDRLAGDRVREILETNGAARRLIGRRAPTASHDEPPGDDSPPRPSPSGGPRRPTDVFAAALMGPIPRE